MMAKEPKVTPAQAKALARIWVDGRCNIAITTWVTPTDKALVKNGWIVPTDETGQYPSLHEYRVHQISEDGLYALEYFLFNQRMKQLSGRIKADDEKQIRRS